MDMCYDGTLVMPSSYAVMDEEEMSYLEGGSAKISFRVNPTTCNRIAALLCAGAGVFAVVSVLLAVKSGGWSLKLGAELITGLLTIASGLFWFASTYSVIEIGLNSKNKAYAKGIC